MVSDPCISPSNAENGFWLDFVFPEDQDGDGELDILADDWGRSIFWRNDGGLFVLDHTADGFMASAP